MALQLDQQRLSIYVTNVEGEGPFLKLTGQLDKQAAIVIESIIQDSLISFEQGVGAATAGSIVQGLICCAKYKDGAYYRAKVISTSNLPTGLIKVHFIDFGNKDLISLSAIRLIDNCNPVLLQMPGLASDFFLARFMNTNGSMVDAIKLKIQSLLCYGTYTFTIDAQTCKYPLISINYQGADLSEHFVMIRYGTAVSLTDQEALLQQLLADTTTQIAGWQRNYNREPIAYNDHAPFLNNQNFPSNPASAMRLQQNPALNYNRSYSSPVQSSVNQRLNVSRAAIPNRAQLRTGRVVPFATITPPPQVPATPSKTLSPKKAITYKSRLLEVNSQHNVYISYADEGPDLFAVQLESDDKKLENLMIEINKHPLHSLTEPPMIGTVCLGRYQELKKMARAIVMNLSGDNCKLFFVDFGNTKMVSYYDIFDIPEEFVKPNVFAMRFCLSGVKSLINVSNLADRFKRLVRDQVLTLKVVPPEGPPLIQYAELFLNNQNVYDLLLATPTTTLQFKWMDMLPMGCKQSVLVSYVDSCIKFFVQLSDNIDDLNTVMENVRIHCEQSTPLTELSAGRACCAKFPDDGNWYRAYIKKVIGTTVLVSYVDYGNEQEIDKSDLRTITSELIQLPAQAMKCALKGFETKQVETKTSNQLEMLALEKTLMAHVVGTLSNDTMLVVLVNESVSPPLDVAKRMMQLSQPRSATQETKQPVHRTDSSFSSPDSEDSNRKYHREKSFKEERRPRDDNMGQRGGSFRGKDRESTFDRSGPGRHSEKFGGRQDRGERHGSSKPWENKDNLNRSADDEWEESSQPLSNQRNMQNLENRSGQKPWENKREPISAADDEWNESPSQPTQNSGQNRDRRKPRMNPEKSSHKPGWKSKSDGFNKRLGQSTAEPSVLTSRASVQDRLRRDNGFKKQDDREDNRSNNHWEGRNNYGGDRRERQDRRDNRGEKRDNRSERNDDNRREYRDRGERGERGQRGGRAPRSDFGSRDRRDRYFGSEDRSLGSDVGRATPFKPRGRFSEVQYKELLDPVPLETPFAEPSVESGTQHEVSVTWIISPESFYTQILSLQPKFLEMMQTIPDLYKGVKPFTGTIPEGASVLARYPEDGVLYRATVVSVQPFGKFIVQYVDFGNKFLVEAKDIWQLERQLLELPKMAIHCSLLGVAPKDGEWKANNEIDLCFNAPRYQCIFQDCVEGTYKVSLWNNSVSVADMLVEKSLAIAEQTSEIVLKDEAIDLTIIVGQQMVCRVTHVESFEKFYVQLDVEKATIVEETITNFDSSLLTPIPPESLCEDIHCTVRHEDKVYRAKLLDVSDLTNISAVLPDYGNVINVSVENVMILPTELSVYYYQSLECCFNNYTSESNKLMTLEQLKETLTGNKFIVYINDVDGITVVTTLYDLKSGKKICVFEPDEGAYDEVVQLCTRAVYNYNFGMAYLAYAENLNEIYLQKSADIDKIETMLNELYTFYEEGTPEPIEELFPEALCAAKSSDGNWYRATVVSAGDADCKVQFSDYGNTEMVPLENIKKLDVKFYEPCALALVASLGLVALRDDALDTLKEWIGNKEVQVTLAFGTDGWLASLHFDGVDLSMKLVNEQFATPKVAPTEETEEGPNAEEPMSLPDGCTQVYISHIDSPGQFYLQMSDKIDKIEEIQAELQTKTEAYPDIENREIGTLCVAKYSADDLWYRAEILDSDSDITTVRFIDYGNADVLDNKPGLLKTMPDHLKAIDRMAVKSSVNAIPTGTGQWSEPASDYFTKLVGDISLPVNALIVLKDIYTYVDLFINGQNITDKLVSEGHATRSEVPEYGDWPSCFASHVNSPAEFWIQLESAAPDLQAMEMAMVDAENFPELESKEEGVLCAAKYTEDDAWYRAQVIVDGSEGTEVLFMDYGNASIATELRSLPDELKSKPALSRKCALQKPRDIKNWSRKSEMKFNEIAAEGATIFNVQFIAAGDISIVELYHEGKSVTEELIELCEPQTERPTPLGQDQRNTGKISYIHQLDEFYIHLDDKSSELDKVTERMFEVEEFDAAAELKVGSLCAAFWVENEQWYRAKVLEFCDVGAHVQFIDYGNKSKCESFKQLPNDLILIEPLAKCCRLASLSDSEIVNENLKTNFVKFLDEGASFQIEFLDSTKEPMLVKLLLNDDDVTNILKKCIASDTGKNVDSEKRMKTENNVIAQEENYDFEAEDFKDDDLDSSHLDLNESGESNHTVIENKYFGTSESNEDKINQDEDSSSENKKSILNVDVADESLSTEMTNEVLSPSRECNKEVTSESLSPHKDATLHLSNPSEEASTGRADEALSSFKESHKDVALSEKVTNKDLHVFRESNKDAAIETSDLSVETHEYLPPSETTDEALRSSTETNDKVINGIISSLKAHENVLLSKEMTDDDLSLSKEVQKEMLSEEFTDEALNSSKEAQKELSLSEDESSSPCKETNDKVTAEEVVNEALSPSKQANNEVIEEALHPSKEIDIDDLSLSKKVQKEMLSEEFTDEALNSSKEAQKELSLSEDESSSPCKETNDKVIAKEVVNEALSPSKQANKKVIEEALNPSKEIDIDVILTEEASEVLSDNVEISSGSVKTPNREESKESVTTDTGYTSEQEKSPESENQNTVTDCDDINEKTTVNIKISDAPLHITNDKDESEIENKVDVVNNDNVEDKK